MAKLIIKNTFLEVTEASNGQCRAASCPPDGGRRTALDRSAGDMDSCARPRRAPGPLSGFDPILGAEKKEKPAAGTRTPLSSSASAFVPGFSLPADGRVQAPKPPAEASALGLSEESAEPSKYTTVMMRNLPCGFKRHALIRLLASKGFAGSYDFLYMPIDFRTRHCLGYAFVNLISEKQTQLFIDCFDGFKDWCINSEKVCTVSPSQTQGLSANIARYQNSPVMGQEVPDSFKPMLFVGKQQVPFPEPTRQVPGVVLRKPRD